MPARMARAIARYQRAWAAHRALTLPVRVRCRHLSMLVAV